MFRVDGDDPRPAFAYDQPFERRRRWLERERERPDVDHVDLRRQRRRHVCRQDQRPCGAGDVEAVRRLAGVVGRHEHEGGPVVGRGEPSASRRPTRGGARGAARRGRPARVARGTPPGRRGDRGRRPRWRGFLLAADGSRRRLATDTGDDQHSSPCSTGPSSRSQHPAQRAAQPSENDARKPPHDVPQNRLDATGERRDRHRCLRQTARRALVLGVPRRRPQRGRPASSSSPTTVRPVNARHLGASNSGVRRSVAPEFRRSRAMGDANTGCCYRAPRRRRSVRVARDGTASRCSRLSL
jgi:hypothetical protein